MNEESITGLMHRLIIVMCEESKKQNKEKEVIKYIDEVLEEYEESEKVNKEK